MCRRLFNQPAHFSYSPVGGLPNPAGFAILWIDDQSEERKNPLCPICPSVCHRLCLPLLHRRKIPLMRAAQKRGIPIEWMPFELTTTDKPPVDTWNDPVRREKWAATLIPFCEQQGMSFHFPPHVIPRPYTNLAFMGWYYACEHGKGEEYNIGCTSSTLPKKRISAISRYCRLKRQRLAWTPPILSRLSCPTVQRAAGRS